jgi:hypothetical protein
LCFLKGINAMDNLIAEYFKKAAAEIQGTFENAYDIRLEEYSKYREEIVVSFLVPKPMTPLQKSWGMQVSPLTGVPAERVYKVIEFDAEHNVSKVKMYH